MNEELKQKFSTLMYFMTKKASEYSFNEFLEENDVTYEEWKLIKNELKDKYDVDTYI